MFIQTITAKAADPEGLLRQVQRWQEEVKPFATGHLGTTAGVSADGKFWAFVRFESEADWQATSTSAQREAWLEETKKYFDGEPTFSGTDDITVWQDPGNSAQFVQVIESTIIDRPGIEKLMDSIRETMANQRPDILGMVTIWGQGTATEIVYFTSEAAAHEGEKTMDTEEMKMEDMQKMSSDWKFTDLVNPILY